MAIASKSTMKEDFASKVVLVSLDNEDFFQFSISQCVCDFIYLAELPGISYHHKGFNSVFLLRKTLELYKFHL